MKFTVIAMDTHEMWRSFGPGSGPRPAAVEVTAEDSLGNRLIYTTSVEDQPRIGAVVDPSTLDLGITIEDHQ